MNAPDMAFAAALPADTQRPLLPALLHNATRMNFFRLCELIELAAPNAAPLGTTDSPNAEPVRFRSRARLGFPHREIDGVEFDDDDPSAPPTVRTTFLGLYGVDARLPPYFADEIAQNHEGAEPLAAFLDLFHHRVVTQLYRIWRKYRYPAGFREDGSDAVSRYLFSFSGFGFTAPKASSSEAEADALAAPFHLHPRKLLSMLGLAAQRTRTAEGLAGVLRHVVPDALIEVEEFLPVWRVLDRFEPAALGEQCLLGRGFFDRANTVRIAITPHTRETVLALTPGGRAYREVMVLLRFYLGYESEAQLDMIARADLMPEPMLAPKQANLGFTTQLAGSSTRRDEARITRVQLGCWNGSRGIA